MPVPLMMIYLMAMNKNQNSIDIHFMRLALSEASKGLGCTSPNPCVGSVVVKDGKVIAVGYHKKAGTPHAEIHALNKAGTKAKGATIYVTLEPCSHTGKTPPCCVAIVKAGIERAVIGMLDPNPLVDGEGLKYLQKHGVQVTTRVLENECCRLNKPFIKFITTRLPLVVLKAGVSLDGRLNYERGKTGWITGSKTTERVHELRHSYDAILVGSQTIKIDNPSLTTRLKDTEGVDAIRIILDTSLSIALSCKILNLESRAQTWIFCGNDVDIDKRKNLEEMGIKVFPVRKDSRGCLDLVKVIEKLGKRNITSVLVEGGGSIHSSFLRRQLVDQVCLFYAPIFAGNNGVALTSDLNIPNRENAIGLVNIRYTRLGDDIMVEGDVSYPNMKLFT